MQNQLIPKFVRGIIEKRALWEIQRVFQYLISISNHNDLKKRKKRDLLSLKEKPNLTKEDQKDLSIGVKNKIRDILSKKMGNNQIIQEQLRLLDLYLVDLSSWPVYPPESITELPMIFWKMNHILIQKRSKLKAAIKWA